MGVSVYTTKDFTKFKYNDSYKDDISDFVGPAESVEEAEEIYVGIEQEIRDKFAIKIEIIDIFSSDVCRGYFFE